MRRRVIASLIVVFALAAYAAGFALLNGNPVASSRDIEAHAIASAPEAGEALTVMTWNLGYGGLGAGSDFVADGGEHYFPPSGDAVRANVDGIAATLAREVPNVDVILTQEIARGGPVNYWVDLKKRVDWELRDRSRAFFADFKTRLMPWPLRMTHGQAIFSQFALRDLEVVPLPAEDSAIFGVKRRYAALASRSGDWTFVSVHLAAFDENATVRTEQLRELLVWAQREYEAGRHVVIGGDFNLRLVETNFPNTTEERFLFWVYPFPQDALPQGWRIGADATTPSVRTNERPYRAGENYTTVIDGFIVSPNVAVESVRGVDLGFAHADHQPVIARFRAIPRDGG